jgi:hypothetical protein
LAFLFAEDLVTTIVGPDGAANRATAGVIESERFRAETNGGS